MNIPPRQRAALSRIRERVFAHLRANRRNGMHPRSLREIALEHGWARSHLTMILRGERQNPTILGMLQKFAARRIPR